MNTRIIKSIERGTANYGWLQANYSFSFANYYNPSRINFGALRVLNDDKIAPGMGFGTHPHDNMEIITIPLKGSLKHRDSMSNKWIPIYPNEVQVMSAGTGVMHSEMNNSTTDELSLFQIWILPNKMGVEPRYDQKVFDKITRKNELQVVVSSFENENFEDSLKIHQDALISRIDLDVSKEFSYQISSKNHGVFIMVIEGEIEISNNQLYKRDAIEISQTESSTIKSLTESELLFIEVPLD